MKCYTHMMEDCPVPSCGVSMNDSKCRRPSCVREVERLQNELQECDHVIGVLRKQVEVLQASQVEWCFMDRELIRTGDLEGMKARAKRVEAYDLAVHKERDKAVAALKMAQEKKK